MQSRLRILLKSMLVALFMSISKITASVHFQHLMAAAIPEPMSVSALIRIQSITLSHPNNDRSEDRSLKSTPIVPSQLSIDQRGDILDQHRKDASGSAEQNGVDGSQNRALQHKRALLSKASQLLYEAIISGDVAWAKFALDKGADVTALDEHGCTPLHWAAIKDSPVLLGLLCDRGARVDAVDHELCTALHIAASHGNYECSSILLEKGASRDVCNIYGKTPIDLAHDELAEHIRAF